VTVLRKGDISITICQDNEARRLVIESADEGIENIIGYALGELKEMELQDILPDAVNDHLENYLDYKDEGNDLANVLSKVRDFGFLTKLGKEARVDMRVARAMAEGPKPRFNLIIRDAAEVSGASNRVLKHLRGHQQLDALTGLPNRETFMRDMEFVNFCLEKERIRASFALVAIDQLAKIIKEDGRPAAGDLLKETAMRCKLNFRTDDFLAYLENDCIAAILLEAPKAEALIPLNRLRYQMANKPLDYTNPEGTNSSITLTIAYLELKKGDAIDAVINRCLDAITKAQEEGGNKIIALDDED
jgi:diguanylate cyclase (GGDEF)-like protein